VLPHYTAILFGCVCEFFRSVCALVLMFIIMYRPTFLSILSVLLLYYYCISAVPPDLNKKTFLFASA